MIKIFSSRPFSEKHWVHLHNCVLKILQMAQLVDDGQLLRGVAVVVGIFRKGVRMDYDDTINHMDVAVGQVGRRVGNEEGQQRRSYDMSAIG